jgi:hypothetical protein
MNKLFHWKSQGVDIFIMSGSEASARTQLISDFTGWRWQNPKRFDAVLVDLQHPPYFVANANHTITIDGKE